MTPIDPSIYKALLDQVADGVYLPVSASVSIGGTLALPDDTADTLIKRADQLMYRNKTNGDLAKNGKPVL